VCDSASRLIAWGIRVTALDRILPEPALVERHHVDIAAPAKHVWPYARQLDLARIPWVRMLFALRTLPDRLAGSKAPMHVRIDDLVSSHAAPGFQILSDDPPYEVAVGAIGKVWRPTIPFVHVENTKAFANFAERGFVKVAWAIRVIPGPRESVRADECRVEVEVRVRATDPESWRRFKRYFRVIGPASRLIRRAALTRLAREVELAERRRSRELTCLAEHLDGGLPLATLDDVAQGLAGATLMTLALMTPFLRGAREHWGLRASDARRVYAGDDLIPAPRWLWTHAVEIDAPASVAWRWVAQIGADRGGFYSYQWLENLVGCEIQNAETIHADWELVEGDALVLHPDAPPLRVVSVDRGRHVLAYGPPDERARAADTHWATVSWLFLIEPLGACRCRFVSRFRSDYSSDLATRLAFGPLFGEPVGFVMDRRMLLGVKALSEQSWSAAGIASRLTGC
jgi:hypothetical protein